MTTLAYKDGILAADTGVTGCGVLVGFTQKIIRRPADKFLAGACGSVIHCSEFLKLVGMENDEDICRAFDKENLESEGVLISPTGLIRIYESGGSFTMRADFYAAGSGASFAMGAMEMGATAVGAVMIARKFDTETHGDITHVKHADD